MPRFLQGEEMAYVMGDASAAYSSAETGEDYGLKKFHRHLLLLKPDIIVVYDEMEADHPASWSWLLHSMAKIHIAPATHRFPTSFDGFYCSSKLWPPQADPRSLAHTFAVSTACWTVKLNPF